MADDTPPLKKIEGFMETALFSSRWLLAPFYLGLALSLVVLLIKFLAELGHIAAHAFTATESEVILGVLALVDLALTGSLIVIVIFSGYENFVSRIDHGDHKDWPEWMGKIDFSALKLKLLSSIVAISAIQLLKQFMSINTVSDRDLMWLVIVHVVFVVSSVFLALSDRIAVHPESGHHGKKSGGGGGGGGGGHESAREREHGDGDHTPAKAAAGRATDARNASRQSAVTTAPAPSAEAARAAGKVQVTRIEIHRRDAAPTAATTHKPVATQRATTTDPRRPAEPSPTAGNARHQPAHNEPLLPGERPPTIKRRLH